MIDARTRRPLVLASVIAGMAMIAVEATIVSTAMPQIVARLGGLQLYSWVFAAFLLTQTATTVVFGKLSDLIGRKKVMLGGIAVFLVGSVLCGLAWSMPAMIAFRLIQGVGAGAIQPVAMTIVGDLYSAHERGKIQGYLASVWAISAVLGPLVGGLIIQHFSWAWIFWINIPVGALSVAGFLLYLHEDVAKGAGRIDPAGTALFTLAIAAVMAFLTEASTASYAESAAIGAVAVVGVVLFFWRDSRSPEPMISLQLWGRRAIASANAGSLFGGMVMSGLTTFLPMFVQGVMGRSALVGGFALSIMVLGWPIGATLAARSVVRFGLRPVMILGAVLIPIGAFAFVVLSPSVSPLVAGVGSLVVGLGMGLLSSASIMMIQEIVDWSERGSATASFLFARSLGNTFGATLFGAVLNYWLVRAGVAGVGSSDKLRDLIDGVARDAAAAQTLRTALESALHITFVSMFAIALLTALSILPAPRVKLERRQPLPTPQQAE
jgi:MFS family permease